MSSRNKQNDYLTYQKTLLGAALEGKDKTYLPYVGADWRDAETLAGLKFMQKRRKITNPRTLERIEDLEIYFEERRKAFFMTIGGDTLTKLAYLVGDTKLVRDANERIFVRR